MDLDEVVRKHRAELVGTANGVEASEEFGLGTACALIADGTVVPTTLTGLRNHLPCSAALASEPIERFLVLRARVGFDAAFEAMSADDEVGEEFVREWDQAQKDLATGAVMTLNDLAAMVTQAQEGWKATPRRMLVVVRSGDKVQSGTVPVEWVLIGR